ncbi:MAG TPA: hypothetical protein VHA76_04060, partial [Solirubrobacterales bacterium]|nr:hypothetical protein [Solirubrobacterales bacterium]
GRTGLLLPPREPWRWVEEIAPLLDDPDRRAKMSARAAAEARRRFPIDRHIAAILDVYAAFGEPPQRPPAPVQAVHDARRPPQGG